MHIQQGPYAYYVSVGWGCSVCLWPDPDRGDGASAASRVVRKLEGHTDDVLSVSRVGVELYDSSLHSFYRLASSFSHTLFAPSHHALASLLRCIYQVAFCPPTTLCTGSYDGTIIVWNLVSGALKYRLHHPSKKGDLRTLPGLQPGCRDGYPSFASVCAGRSSLTFSAAIEALTFLTNECSLLRDWVTMHHLHPKPPHLGPASSPTTPVPALNPPQPPPEPPTHPPPSCPTLLPSPRGACLRLL